VTAAAVGRVAERRGPPAARAAGRGAARLDRHDVESDHLGEFHRVLDELAPHLEVIAAVLGAAVVAGLEAREVLEGDGVAALGEGAGHVPLGTGPGILVVGPVEGAPGQVALAP
jgi:hypothetical protein